MDAKNYGTINGVIDNFDITIYQEDGVTPYDGSTPEKTLPDYIKYSFKYADGSDVEKGDVIEAGQSKKYRFRIEYDSLATELPEEPVVIKPVVEITEVQTRENDNKPYTMTSYPPYSSAAPSNGTHYWVSPAFRIGG